MKMSILVCLAALFILAPSVQAQNAAHATVTPFGAVVHN